MQWLFGLSIGCLAALIGHTDLGLHLGMPSNKGTSLVVPYLRFVSYKKEFEKAVCFPHFNH